MRYKLCFVIAGLLIFSGCKADQSAKIAEQDIISLKQQLDAQKNELAKINEKATGLAAENQQLKDELAAKQNTITEAQQQSADNQKYIDSLKRDYEDLFFLTCSEANSYCPGELKYFDPRKIKQGDSILGMKVKAVQVGMWDPGSYIVSFADTVDVSGKYIADLDDPMGPTVWLDTTTLNGQECTVHLALGGNQDELMNALKGSKKGEIKLKLKDITLQTIFHKPSYSSATFVKILR